MAVNGAGDELLARAAFAGDQYRSIGPCHQCDAFEDFLHRGTVAEQFIFDSRRHVARCCGAVSIGAHQSR